jgi:hypothetical protein
LSPDELKGVLVVSDNGVTTPLSTLKVPVRSVLMDDPRPPVPGEGNRAQNLAQGRSGVIELAGGFLHAWKATANRGSGFVQTVFQVDGQGHRRALVRGYQVVNDHGDLKLNAGYWSGTAFHLSGERSLEQEIALSRFEAEQRKKYGSDWAVISAMP